jgi:AP-3 complex subunit beta
VKSHIDKPALVSMEEIPSLEPGQKAKRTLLVRFHHHILPLKLALFCNDKKFPVKLRPDIGYFVKPLPINIEAFKDKESHLPGMFEYVRRYDNFDICFTIFLRAVACRINTCQTKCSYQMLASIRNLLLFSLLFFPL